MSAAPHDLARIAYEAYGETTGHKNVRGEELPAWQELGETVQTAWTASARAVLQADRADRGEQ
ncbi:hypothetical protein ABTZ78_17525 [Streptomyces bauhiniae]|uniref:hypothetical protein n=1 Tax=Streptomyces bauhiniae TaxID=2340725 RepID=UPI003332D870